MDYTTQGLETSVNEKTRICEIEIVFAKQHWDQNMKNPGQWSKTVPAVL